MRSNRQYVPYLPLPRLHSNRATSILRLDFNCALCKVLVLSRSHDSGNRICIKCYSRARLETRLSYTLGSKHFINVGDTWRAEKCVACQIQFSAPRPLDDCDACPESFANVLEYIHEVGDTPYDDPEPTIITIRETLENTSPQ